MAVEEWVVQKGDNIWDIAGQLLTAQQGQPPTLAQQVAEMNRIISLNLGQLNNNPDLIHPGQKLKVGTGGAPSPGSAIQNGKGNGTPQQSANPEGEGVGGNGNIAGGGEGGNKGGGGEGSRPANPSPSQYPESEGVPPGGNIAHNPAPTAPAAPASPGTTIPKPPPPGGYAPGWTSGGGGGGNGDGGGSSIFDRLMSVARATSPGRTILDSPVNQAGFRGYGRVLQGTVDRARDIIDTPVNRAGMRGYGGVLQEVMDRAPVFDTAPNRWAREMLQRYGNGR